VDEGVEDAGLRFLFEIAARLAEANALTQDLANPELLPDQRPQINAGRENVAARSRRRESNPGVAGHGVQVLLGDQGHLTPPSGPVRPRSDSCGVAVPVEAAAGDGYNPRHAMGHHPRLWGDVDVDDLSRPWISHAPRSFSHRWATRAVP